MSDFEIYTRTKEGGVWKEMVLVYKSGLESLSSFIDVKMEKESLLKVEKIIEKKGDGCIKRI